jgi:hypothetical protein
MALWRRRPRDGGPATGSRYQMRRWLISVGDDYSVDVRDSYGVEIAPGEDDGLVLAITVCMDAMTPRGN